MRKILFFILYFIIPISNIVCDIPKNIIVNENTSIFYEIVDEEKYKVIITINGIKYEDIMYCSIFTGEERLDIPFPVYLGTYKNSIILLKGYGSSYRNLIVYQNKDKYIKKIEYENSISIISRPTEVEKYIFIYDTYPVLIIKTKSNIIFKKLNVIIEKEIHSIEIYPDEIIINMKGVNKKIIIND